MTIIPTFEWDGDLYSGWTVEDALIAGVPQATIDDALLTVEGGQFKTFYVDSIAGNDSWSGLAPERPFLTLGAALDQCSNQKSCNASIKLAADGAYVIPHDKVYVTYSCDTKIIKYTAPTIGPYNGRVNGTPTITQPNLAITTAPTKLAGFALKAGSIDFIDIHLITASEIPQGVGSNFTGFISASTGGAFIAFRMSTGKITINAAPLINVSAPNIRLVGVHGITILRPTGSVPLVDLTTGVLMLSVGTCTIPAGSKWPDDLIIGLNRFTSDTSVRPGNVISNVSMTY